MKEDHVKAARRNLDRIALKYARIKENVLNAVADKCRKERAGEVVQWNFRQTSINRDRETRLVEYVRCEASARLRRPL